MSTPSVKGEPGWRGYNWPDLALATPGSTDVIRAVAMNESHLLQRVCNGNMMHMKMSESEMKLKGLCFYVPCALRIKVLESIISADDNSKSSYFYFASILQSLLNNAAATAACDGSKIVKLLVDLSDYDSITGMDGVKKCITMTMQVNDIDNVGRGWV
jgi:hypothetical protein